jgi:hypothetical protein
VEKGKEPGARSQEPERGWLGKSQVEQLLQLQHFFWLVTKLHTRARAIISAVGVSSFTFFLSRSWVGERADRADFDWIFFFFPPFSFLLFNSISLVPIFKYGREGGPSRR